MKMPGQRLLSFLVLTLIGANAPAEQPATPAPEARYLFQVVLHTPAEIEKLLARAEQLAATQRPSDRRAGIALVLHGPEVELFARRNYAKYRQLVDRAAKLDADGVIEVKMCQTEMRSRGIREQDVPGFIELVPYGPDEEERLKRRGYVYL
ncbi:MAG: hypothetical protein EPN55_11685 [Gammaproteobacteria bacterium]|nr:MAG: hypothetical protein EPN55_11685 [Gammaproteobacteria bacterium]